VLADRARVLPPIIEDVRSRLAIVNDWIARDARFEWVAPKGGCVGLVHIRDEIDTVRFYDALLAEHGTYVGPGHWFEADDHYFRLGFGWPSRTDLQTGLAGLSSALDGT